MKIPTSSLPLLLVVGLIIFSLVLVRVVLLMPHQENKHNIDPDSVDIELVDTNSLENTTPAIHLAESLSQSISAYQQWLIASDKDQWPENRFYKVDFNGELLDHNSSHWSCVFDSFNGLMWEVKDNSGGWQDQEHTYSWYSPPSAQNEELDVLPPVFGNSNKGICFEIDCDTHHYKIYANENWLCSSNQWRLPEAYELALLDTSTKYSPDIDTDFFPNTMPGLYWTRTQPPNQDSLVWAVDFKNGFPYIKEKRIPSYLRLVTKADWLKINEKNVKPTTKD
jgi:hypothetical protein